MVDAWFPFFVGDYVRDTQHLSQGEHGAYLGLMMFYYSRQQPIHHAKAYAIAYAKTMQEKRCVDAVLQEFFKKDGDFWRHNRIDREIEKRMAISEKRQAAAEKRWGKVDANAYANGYANDDANSMPSQPQSQSHSVDKSTSSGNTTHIPPKTKVTPDATPKTRKAPLCTVDQYLAEHPNATAEWANYAASTYGWHQQLIDEDLRNFLGYWRSDDAVQSGRKRDWNQTWRNRCTNLAEKRTRVVSSQRQNHSAGHDRISAIASASMATAMQRNGLAGRGGTEEGTRDPSHDTGSDEAHLLPLEASS